VASQPDDKKIILPASPDQDIWLLEQMEYVIRNIMTTKYKDVPALYPQNYKNKI